MHMKHKEIKPKKLNFLKFPSCTLLRINLNAEDFIEIIMQSV